MKRIAAVTVLLMMAASSLMAAPLGFSARSAIPAQVQQIISVDYRALRNSESGMALKSRVLPDNLKQFETALRKMNIEPDKDVEQLAFVLFRDTGMMRSVGLAQGAYDLRKFEARMKQQGVKAVPYGKNLIYPTGTGMYVCFLDASTMVFGDQPAVRKALRVRDGQSSSLGSNGEVADLISNVESEAVWSVLDKSGTEHMMGSAVGEAGSLSEYNNVKQRMIGSHYSVDFNHGIKFHLNVMTTDTVTAGTLANLLRTGMAVKKQSGTATEKTAIESLNVDNSSSSLTVVFAAGDKQFQSLLHSNLFAGVTR